MSILIMKAKDGTEIFVETDDSPKTKLQLRKLKSAKALAGPKVPSFDEIGRQIASACGEVLQGVNAVAGIQKPNELTLQFGIKISGEKGIPLIVNSKVEASLTVTAKWVL